MLPMLPARSRDEVLLIQGPVGHDNHCQEVFGWVFGFTVMMEK